MSALSVFDFPGFSPNINAVVFLVTEEVTTAPRARNLSSASSRPMDAKVPVTIYDFPANGKSSVFSTTGTTPNSFISVSNLRFSSSLKYAKIDSATTSPISGIARSSSFVAISNFSKDLKFRARLAAV
nr:hypothetical protein [Candidatus Nanosyncoccus alces]